jgi:hypothetical protein
MESGLAVTAKLIIDSAYVKAMIVKANDPNVPEADKSTEVLSFKDAELLPSYCYSTELNTSIPKGGSVAPINVTLHKPKMASLSDKKR